MNKRKLWIISIAMTLSVIGVILIQVYWITNAYDTIRERFFREVDDKLDAVIEKHEVLLTLDLIDDIDKRGFVGLSNFEKQRKILSNADSTEVVFKKYDIDIEEVTFEASAEKMMRMKKSDPGIWSNQIDSNALRKEAGQLSDVYYEQDSQKVDFKQLKRDMDGHLFRMLRSFLTTYPDIDRVQIERYLDSLINIEMAQINRSLNFQYEVVEDKNDSLKRLFAGGYSMRKDCNTIRKQLFPSSTAPHHLQLLVKVVDPSNIIISKMRIVLVSSALFLLIIIYSFVYTLNSLIKQGKLSQMKSDFINNMTHELKTPITTISLATEALMDKKLEISPEKVGSMSKLIAKENDRLKSQVERVLQMERLDRNKIKLEKKELHVNDLLNEILESVRIQVENKNGQIAWSLNAKPDMVLADELHLSNIIYNLIDNAIKYSKDELDIYVSSNTRNQKIFIDIEDKGIGIAKDLQNRVFERFYRVPTGNLHDVKGFGLGLSYVKEMMLLHEGDVKLVSKEGAGSTFTLIFPINKSIENE